MRPGSLTVLRTIAGLATLAFAASCARSGPKPAGGRDDSAILVTVEPVRARAMNVYLEGIGSVQALNTVVVRPQVDGKLVKVMFLDGQDVHRGDVLAQIDPRPYQSVLDQALAKRDQDQVQVGFAQKVVDRDLQLKNLIDQQTLDQHRAALQQLQALANADEAAVNNARLQLEFTTIAAPMDGRVGFRLVNEGNIVSATDTAGIAVIKQVQPISAVFTLPEKSISALSAAAAKAPARAPLTVLACDRDNRETLVTGTLDAIDNTIDQTSGTIKLKATFANQPQALWPGQFINVKLLVSHFDSRATLPAAAVQQGAKGTFVYMASKDAKAVVRPVKVAMVENDIAYIESGVEIGEAVVVDGQYSLQPNAPIQAKTPQNPAPAK